MSSSSASMSSPGDEKASSPRSQPAGSRPTGQSPTTPIPTAIVEGVANLGQDSGNEQDLDQEDTAAHTQRGDEDSESGFWDIIGDSHMKLESYGDQTYDHEMTESPPDYMSAITSPSISLVPSSAPSTNLPTTYGDLINSEALLVPPPMLTSNHAAYPGIASPNAFVTFEQRQNGTPFPLSKPIVREDGLLLVGTEITTDPSAHTNDKNRIFVTNFLTPTGATQSPAHIMVEQEVRDIHWISTDAAIVAIGKEIQLIQLGDLSVGGPCRLQDPINAVHSDSIRELAVSPTTNSHVLSGGFDERVVLIDLRNTGDPNAAAVIKTFDANDVVSSVRWAPTDSHFSWTTDVGDFQVADTRVRSPQLQIPLYTVLNVDKLGGLFAHEYLGSFNIALGFERGHIAIIDTRMPRQHSCTSLIESKLAAVGEIRRSKSDKFAIFGHGGFSTASLNGTTSSLVEITRQHQLHQISPQVSSTPYKTSGDFSYETGVYLAVSDNMGIVSVYTDDTIFKSSAAFSGW